MHISFDNKHDNPLLKRQRCCTLQARREEMIREAAFFRSQHRQACVGKELGDRLVAEEQIDRMLTDTLEG
jgi:hypothetical protein